MKDEGGGMKGKHSTTGLFLPLENEQIAAAARLFHPSSFRLHPL